MFKYATILLPELVKTWDVWKDSILRLKEKKYFNKTKWHPKSQFKG